MAQTIEEIRLADLNNVFEYLIEDEVQPRMHLKNINKHLLHSNNAIRW